MNAEETQSLQYRKDMEKFHDALQTVYSPKNYGTTTLLNVDGSIQLIDKASIAHQPSTTMQSTDCRRKTIQVSCLMNSLLDEFPPVTETMKAIQHLCVSSRKVPGSSVLNMHNQWQTNLQNCFNAGGERKLSDKIQGCTHNSQTERESATLFFQ